MKINFVGDFAILKDVSNVKVDAGLKEILKAADFNVVDYEVPIHTDEPSILKSGPLQSQDPKSVDWLRKNGFNVATMANNHSFDYGEQAFMATREKLLSFSKVCGAGTWDEAYQPVLLEKAGVKVAILSVAELQFTMLFDTWSQKDRLGCAWINHARVNQTVRQLKKEDYVVIISAHSGLEKLNVPLPEWRDRYRELIDLGVDVVVGGHTHMAQGYEIYNGKPIFYATGNFAYQEDGEMFEDWWRGFCVTLDITTKGINFEINATRFDNETIHLESKEFTNTKLNKLNGLLQEEVYILYINKVCLEKLEDYYGLFAMGGLFRVDKKWVKNIARMLLHRYHPVHTLNNLQCESHRWCITRGLRLLNSIL